MRREAAGDNAHSDPIVVVAGILRDRQGRVLLARRPAGKHLAGTWEFPGGKCDPDESPEAALARELKEELGIGIPASEPLLTLTHDYPDRRIRLLLRTVADHRGRPRGLEGQELAWVAPADLHRYDMPPADRPIVKALALDGRYAITPNPTSPRGRERLVEWAEQCLAGGIGLIQLRAPLLEPHELADLATCFGPVVRRHGGRWLLNGPPELAEAAGANGVHLNARRLMSLARRPLADDRLVIASCHDAGELERAGAIGADFVTVSPVRPTPSHPQAVPLGWPGLARMCEVSPLPVFALGGLDADDLGRARRHGAFGVAGIRGFA